MLICEVQPVVVAWDLAEQRVSAGQKKFALFASKPLILSKVVLVAFTSLLALSHY